MQAYTCQKLTVRIGPRRCVDNIHICAIVGLFLFGFAPFFSVKRYEEESEGQANIPVRSAPSGEGQFLCQIP